MSVAPSRVSATSKASGPTSFVMMSRFHAVISHPDEERCQLRDRLHDEEAQELAEALEAFRTAKTHAELAEAQRHVAKELADVVYVVYGTAHALGIILDRALERVHTSNMTKLSGPRREDGKLLKPPGYESPDLSDVVWPMTVEEAGWR